MKITVDGESAEVNIEVEKRAKSVAFLIIHPETSEAIEIEIGTVELARFAGMLDEAKVDAQIAKTSA
jgi:hypothetical protein